MFARFGTLLIIVISAVLVFSVTADAINVDSVGPESSYDNYIFTGSTQYSRAEFNEPFHSVYWYVKGPGETGFGTLVYTDYGDGTSESSQFSHSFSNGSTSGEEYEITAYVYPVSDADDQSVDWDSYTLGIFTPFEEVLMVPDELTITDDIKLNDYYAFTVDASSSDSNYVITSVEVYVNGSLNTSRSFSDASSASVSAAGFLSANAGPTISVKGLIKGYVKSKLQALLTPIGIVGVLDVTWRGMLKGTIFGRCWCPSDSVNLGGGTSHYQCSDPNTTYVYNNVTFVKWKPPNVNNAKGEDSPNLQGKYTFAGQIPLSHEINVTMGSKHLHDHRCTDEVFRKRLCKYEQTKELEPIGKVILSRIPIEWERKEVPFYPSPNVYDPCVIIPPNKRQKL